MAQRNDDFQAKNVVIDFVPREFDGGLSTPASRVTPFDAATAAAMHVHSWQPMRALGTFPVRFPSHLDPGDTGWHVDASFGTEVNDFMEWRVNVQSRGRALLLLFLFSDVGPSDAPTLIRTGSHKEISRLLSEYGDNGMTLRELGSTGFSESSSCAVIEATGPAGTVYLCHPFLVHAGQANRGQKVRFIAQPPLVPVGPLDLRYPVSLAIQRALR